MFLNIIHLDCEIGFYGINCNIKCPYPTFGQGCQSVCNCNVTNCDYVNGCIQSSGGQIPYPYCSLFTFHRSTLFHVFRVITFLYIISLNFKDLSIKTYFKAIFIIFIMNKQLSVREGIFSVSAYTHVRIFIGNLIQSKTHLNYTKAIEEPMVISVSNNQKSKNQFLS